MPPLTAETLGYLRTLVRNVGPGPRAGIPLAEVLPVPASLTPGVALTVDFAAARELGHEIIILRVAAPAAAPRPDPRLLGLSPREREIAALVAAGLSNKQIAARESIALATVKAHVHHILVKTGLPNRAAIAAATVGG